MPTELYRSASIDLRQSQFWAEEPWRRHFLYFNLNSSSRRYLCTTFSPADYSLSPGDHTLWYVSSDPNQGACTYNEFKSAENSSCFVADVNCRPRRHGNIFTVLADPTLDMFVEGGFVANNSLIDGCKGETVRVEGNPGNGDFNSYEWFYNGSRVSDGTIANPLVRGVDINVTWNGTRTYELRSYGPYGARVSATVRIRSNSVNTDIQATAPGINTTANSVTICEGESIDLTSTVAVSSYSWSPSSDLSSTTTRTVTATPSRTRTYTLTATDANGCEEEESITINVQDPDAIGAEAGNSVGICIPTSGTGTGHVRSGRSPSGGTWTCLDCPTGLSIDANGNYSITASAPVGDYTVQYDVTSGRCSDSDTKIIRVVEQPTISMESSVDVCPNSEYRIEPFVSGGSGLSFLWSPALGLNDPTRLNPTVDINNSDLTYTLTVTTSEGCTINRSIDLIVDNSITPDAGSN
ncbi:MAG: hypothetical protein RJQ14_09480, partial [Marinoscillum sp.]